MVASQGADGGRTFLKSCGRWLSSKLVHEWIEVREMEVLTLPPPDAKAAERTNRKCAQSGKISRGGSTQID